MAGCVEHLGYPTSFFFIEQRRVALPGASAAIHESVQKGKAASLVV
jgi:hypothetical protein